ncbi:uncharacterized metal-binding protein YceD (DUF177 family) [Roseovarius sp. MBR-78]|uniref:YceD family protein n=1 Tax=Roseovarius sp. MBR-78 TaxID=3156460 RepID=UPI00339129C4
MTGDGHAPHRLPVAQLARRGGHRFEIVPDKGARAALAARLDLIELRKLRFEGEITPDDGRGWRLDATLGATVVQPCGVTLAPVATRIDEAVTRRYAPDATPPQALPGDEIEMPEDDSIEPLGAVIDLDTVLAEALALALPPWPRSEGATLGAMAAGPVGATPEDAAAPRRPFAGLAGLRDRLSGEGDEDDEKGTDDDAPA